MFEDIVYDDTEMVVTLHNKEANTFVEKRISSGATWDEMLNAFVDMLTGVGYIINKVKVAEAIEEAFEGQTGVYK